MAFQSRRQPSHARQYRRPQRNSTFPPPAAVAAAAAAAPAAEKQHGLQAGFFYEEEIAAAAEGLGPGSSSAGTAQQPEGARDTSGPPQRAPHDMAARSQVDTMVAFGPKISSGPGYHMLRLMGWVSITGVMRRGSNKSSWASFVELFSDQAALSCTYAYCHCECWSSRS